MGFIKSVCSVEDKKIHIACNIKTEEIFVTILVKKQSDDSVHIILGERFDFPEVEHFKCCYENLKDIANKTITIDFVFTKFVDSSALGILIAARNYFKHNNASLRLANANETVSKLFFISKLHKQFDII